MDIEAIVVEEKLLATVSTVNIDGMMDGGEITVQVQSPVTLNAEVSPPPSLNAVVQPIEIHAEVSNAVLVEHVGEIDAIPISGSENAVSSGGVFSALENKAGITHTHPIVTTEEPGFVTPQDKANLDYLVNNPARMEFASLEEVVAGTVDNKAVSPQKLANVQGFVFTQSSPSASWTISHGLNRYPTIAVVDSAGSVVEGQVDYIDLNNIIVNFNGGFSGKAYLS